MKYRNVFVAGTFDGIHRGHEALLERAFEEGESVTIGLTSDEFVRTFKKSIHKDFIARKSELEHRFGDAQIISIGDVHEPAASMPDLDAIVVSDETAFRAREINDLRKKRGLGELAILEVPMVGAEDKQPISSTRVRSGEIDRDGKLVMPDSMRKELAQPLGNILSDAMIAPAIDRHRQDVVISVGDIATETLVEHGVLPTLAIIDQKVNRKPRNTLGTLPEELTKTSIHISSGPGFISKEAVETLQSWAHSPSRQLLVIEGEEDLLALPAILYAPIGSVVYYGQPPVVGGPEQEGIVEVVVSKNTKQIIEGLLKQFVRS